jgi:hypothetical protein
MGNHLGSVPAIASCFLVEGPDAKDMVDVAVGEDRGTKGLVAPCAHLTVDVLCGHDGPGVDHHESVVGSDHGAVAKVRQERDTVRYFGQMTDLAERAGFVRRVFAAPEAVGELNNVHRALLVGLWRFRFALVGRLRGPRILALF